MYRESDICIVVFMLNYKVLCTLFGLWQDCGNFVLHILVKMCSLLFRKEKIWRNVVNYSYCVVILLLNRNVISCCCLCIVHMRDVLMLIYLKSKFHKIFSVLL